MVSQSPIASHFSRRFGLVNPAALGQIVAGVSGLSVGVCQTSDGEVTIFTEGLSQHRLKCPRGSEAIQFVELKMRTPAGLISNPPNSYEPWPFEGGKGVRNRIGRIKVNGS